MAKPLSALERRVLDYLVEYVREHTYQPSVREIGARFEIKSTKTVSEVLQALADKGWIERDSARSRGVRLLGLDLCPGVVSVPHVDVHLTEPSLEDAFETLALDRRIAGGAGCFLMTMVGDEMAAAGIRDGDLLLVEPVASAELTPNELAVARVGGQTFVRRVRDTDGENLLVAESSGSPAIRLADGATDVLGRVGAVVRRLRTDAPAGLGVRERVDEGVVAT